MRALKTNLIAVVAGLAAIPAVAACSSATTGTPTGTASPSVPEGTITVIAADNTCDISTRKVKPGPTNFNVSNKGSDVTEVYVYGKEGDSFSKIVAEVENIGPGTSRSMTADLVAGNYEVACKPGQTGKGVRVGLTVTAS